MSGPPSAPKLRRRRKEARPAEIIEAGLQEFATHGFAAARMEDVASRAGIAKGTIYRYFETKEALFIAAVRSRIPIFSVPIAELIDAYPGETVELLRFLIQRAHATFEDPQVRTLLQIILSEGARFPALTEVYHQEVLVFGRDLLARIVRRGIARGEFQENAVARVPIVLLAPMMMAILWSSHFERHESVPPEAFLQAHLDLILHGILKRK